MRSTFRELSARDGIAAALRPLGGERHPAASGRPHDVRLYVGVLVLLAALLLKLLG